MVFIPGYPANKGKLPVPKSGEKEENDKLEAY
jgi:hypothetical protein